MIEKSNSLFIPVVPMGAVRTTAKAKGWGTDAGKRYTDYKKLITLYTRAKIKSPCITPVSVNVTFYMPIPASWSNAKKERHNGAFHTVKPDIDNLIKGLFDSLNKIAWKDDNQVYEAHSRKVYSYTPGIEFEILEASKNGPS